VIAVEIVGARELARALDEAVRGIPDLAPATVGDTILAAARQRVPVRSGTLRASGSARGMDVRYSAPYAAPVHWGTRSMEPNPWLTIAADRSEDVWVSAYAEALQGELNRKI